MRPNENSIASGNNESSDNSTRFIALSTVALGVLFGSVWASRLCDPFGGVGLAPSFDQVVFVIAAIAFAPWLARQRGPQHRTRSLLFATAVIFFAVHTVAVLLTFVLRTEGELVALSIVSAAFSGVVIAALACLLLTGLIDLPARSSAGVIGGGLLLANLYDAMFLAAPSGIVIAQWLIAGVVVLVLMALLEPSLLSRMNSAITEESDSIDSSVSSDTPPMHIDTHTKPHAQMTFFLIAVAILMLIQGFFAHLTGLGGAGSQAFFGMSTEILVLGTRVIGLVLVVGLAGAHLLDLNGRTSLSVVSLSSLVWTVGLLLVFASAVPQAGENLSTAGMLVIESGMYLLQALVLSMAVASAHRYQAIGSALVMFAAAAVFANQITRNIPLLVNASSANVSLAEATVAWCAFTGILLVVFVLIAQVAVLAHTAAQVSEVSQDQVQRIASDEARTANVSTVDKTQILEQASEISDFANTEGVMRAEYDFARRFRALCETHELTDREVEVLYYALHGYTMDGIADRLGVSRETAKTYLSRVYRRCGVGGRQEILALIDSQTSQ